MQKDNILYRIRNLACSYPGSPHTVLEINQFDVFKGELVFFLGVSGVGKSTLIESLGLMNRTIVNRPETSLHYEGGGRSISLFDLWDGPQTALAKFLPSNTASSSKAAICSRKFRLRTML